MLLQDVVDEAMRIAAMGNDQMSLVAILLKTRLVQVRMARSGGRYALVSLCIGGGQGMAAILERV